MEDRKRRLSEKLKVLKMNKSPRNLGVDEFLKKPIVKAAVVVASVYSVLFISKFFINECAQLIKASKRLRDARKL